MFLRKVTVMTVPLIMLAAICLVSPLLNGLDVYTYGTLRGSLVGVLLALMLPLAGAIRRREPFGGLLWVPAVLTIALIAFQLLSITGVVSVPFLNILASVDPETVQVESIFAAYMLTTCIRTSL